MSEEYFQEFAAQLKRFRESQGVSLQSIALVTRMNQEYLTRLEEGDFSFAADVYVKGYLRTYASQIGLDPTAVLEEFDRILEKIDYVNRDDQAEVSEEVLSSIGAIPETSEAEDRSELDQAVIEKIRKEKQMHAWVSVTSIVLVALAGIQILLSGGREVDGSAEPTEMQAASNVAQVTRRPRLVLSAPIVPPLEAMRREEVADRLLMKQSEIERNLINQEWLGDGPVPRIGIREAAAYLDSVIRQ